MQSLQKPPNPHIDTCRNRSGQKKHFSYQPSKTFRFNGLSVINGLCAVAHFRIEGRVTAVENPTPAGPIALAAGILTRAQNKNMPGTAYVVATPVLEHRMHGDTR